MTCIDEAKKDLRENARPELTNYLDSVDAYSTIVLAYPNYWGTFPIRVPGSGNWNIYAITC